MSTRRCAEDGCPNEIVLDNTHGPPTRQRYCDPCREARRTVSRTAARAGVRWREVAVNLRRNRLWICEYLSRSRCIGCGEDDLAVLRFVHRANAKKAFDIDKMANSGAGKPIEDLAAEAAKCNVVCLNCIAVEAAKSAGSYRIQYLVDVAAGRPPLLPDPRAAAAMAAAPRGQSTTYLRELLAERARADLLAVGRGSGRQGPRRPIPAVVPEPGEFGDAGVIKTEVAGTRATDLPAGQLGAEPTPEQPADGAAKVDVGDVATTVAVGEPVGEAPSGSWMDDAIGAGAEAGFQPGGADGGVSGRRRLVRRERQR